MNRETLHSYLDGELGQDEIARVKAWLASDPAAALEFEQLRAVAQSLDAWTLDGKAMRSDDFVARVCQAAKSTPDLAVLDSGGLDSGGVGRASARRQNGRWNWAWPIAIAAAAVLAVSFLLRTAPHEAGTSVLDSQDYLRYVWKRTRKPTGVWRSKTWNRRS